jgi:hypothetical protein
MNTKIISLIAGAVVAGALITSPASAGDQFGNDLKVNIDAEVQVAGYYSRGRAYVKKYMSRRFVVRTPTGNGVRG